MTEAEAIRKLEAAILGVHAAEAARKEWAKQLQRAVREAREAGVPVARCAEELGMSRQGVYAMLERKEA